VAFLRGVSPINLKMSDLKQCLEGAGFTNVKTLLSSGNAAFDSSSRSVASIERQIEVALNKDLGRTFYTIVRPTKELEALVASDPYADFKLPANAKRVVTFGRTLTKPKQPLPIEKDDARILCLIDDEVFSAYVPGPHGPAFMTLIEKTFGS